MASGYDSDDSSNAVIDFTPALLFNPPSDADTPETLFAVVTGSGRFIRRSNRQQMLIYTDGACINNRNRSDRPVLGGCAFVFKGGALPEDFKAGTVSFRLENRGLSGELYAPTSNRAELRAVIAALQYRAWNGDGFNELVIATDSKYVASGATEWVKGWAKRGWRTSKRKPVINQDLWKLLFKEIQRFKDCPWRSLRVLFWWIPRELNECADEGATLAAATKVACESFTKILGGLV